eukprot:TRINITY_DN7549_c0_g1_i3.p1 TRINITY_DN7549_c0_g1~~TRINITY_DN7549_c0_g1_i3.p1  ORF type:complete len:635 (-),score=108.77 TRINITY_DN7549_c0_g1_i3:2023-3927(-)
MTSIPPLVERFRSWCSEQPNKTLCTFLDDIGAEESASTYQDCEYRAHAVAHALVREWGCHPGDRAVLLYHPGMDFVGAFWGCLFAGVVPVPVYPVAAKIEENTRQLTAVVGACDAKLMLTHTRCFVLVNRLNLETLREGGLAYQITNSLPAQPPLRPVLQNSDQTALLQYRHSGANAPPQATEVTFRELESNLKALHQQMPVNADDVAACWTSLPQSHDEGLIAYILLTCFVGGSCVILSPQSCISRPATWLKVVQQHGITAACAPNFAYDFLVKPQGAEPEDLGVLDLRCPWMMRIDGNGAESAPEEPIISEPPAERRPRAPSAIPSAKELAQRRLGVQPLSWSDHSTDEEPRAEGAGKRPAWLPGNAIQAPPATPKTALRTADARRLFDSIDIDRGGTLTLDEMFHFIECKVPGVSMEEAKGIFTEIDADGDGEITFHEFKTRVLKSPVVTHGDRESAAPAEGDEDPSSEARAEPEFRSGRNSENCRQSGDHRIHDFDSMALQVFQMNDFDKSGTLSSQHELLICTTNLLYSLNKEVQMDKIQSDVRGFWSRHQSEMQQLHPELLGEMSLDTFKDWFDLTFGSDVPGFLDDDPDDLTPNGDSDTDDEGVGKDPNAWCCKARAKLVPVCVSAP